MSAKFRKTERKNAEKVRKKCIKTVDFCVGFGYNHQVTSGVPLPRPFYFGANTKPGMNVS